MRICWKLALTHEGIVMNIADHNCNERVLIIAEIGNNHEGSADRARELVDRAAECGVDAIKLQVFQAEKFISAGESRRLAQLKAFELGLQVHAELCERANRAGLIAIATPFDLESLEFIADEVDAIKIASGDVTFVRLIERAALELVPLIVSTGAATHGEIERAVETIRQVRSDWSYVMNSVALLHCISAYPAPIKELNLRAISTLRTHFGCTVGWSDHSLGIEAAGLAVAAGARIIEKHFTLDKQFSSYRDHQLSADPREMKALVERVRHVESMLGDGMKEPQLSEEEGRSAMRRSAYAQFEIKANTPVLDDDVIWLRPERGIPAGDANRLVERMTTTTISPGDAIEAHMLGELSGAASEMASELPGAR